MLPSLLLLLAARAPRARGALLSRRPLSDLDPLARCVDGSPAVYYWQASATNSSLWIVNLEGGGWCQGARNCRKRCRKKPSQCSSSQDQERVVEGGLFDARQDAVVQEANKVFLPYCTSDAHMGDAEALGGLQFRGARVVQALFTALTKRHGLGENKARLLLAGQSAGARGAMVHLDYVQEMLGETAAEVEVLGFLDSPLWLDVAPFPGHRFMGFGESCRKVQGYAHVRHYGESCEQQYGQEGRWRCIMGQYRMPHVKTPYLLVASRFDSFQLKNNVGHKPKSPEELAYAQNFSERTLQTVMQLRANWPQGAAQQNAVLSWACYSHATSLEAAGFDRQSCNGTTIHSALREFLQGGASGKREWLDQCSGFACGTGCDAGTGAESTIFI